MKIQGTLLENRTSKKDNSYTVYFGALEFWMISLDIY